MWRLLVTSLAGTITYKHKRNDRQPLNVRGEKEVEVEEKKRQ